MVASCTIACIRHAFAGPFFVACFAHGAYEEEIQRTICKQNIARVKKGVREMTKKILSRLGTIVAMLICVLTMIVVLLPDDSQTAYAAEKSILNGCIKVVYDDDTDYGSWTYNEAQGTFTGNTMDTNKYSSNKTTKIKFYNTKSLTVRAIITFDYSIEGNYEKVKISSKSIGKSGTRSIEVGTGTGGCFTLNMQVKSGDGDTTLTISNIRIELAKDVFQAAEHGSYTVTCNDSKGNLVSQTTVSENNLEVERTAGTMRYQLKAVANEDAVFKGWYIVGEDEPFSTQLECSKNTSASTNFYAKFEQNIVNGNFKVSDQFFDDLDKAISYAQTNNCNLIIVKKDVELSKDYTIPAGITLQIPYNDQETLYTDNTEATTTDTQAEVYRTLKLTGNAKLNVEGSLNVGGTYFATIDGQTGKNAGGYGLIEIGEGSQIVVKNGGKLYAWGFISGDGSVSAESGSTVYEYFQIGNFRGGPKTLAMENRVFPFSQYYVQNIECLLTIHQGAEEKVRAAVYFMQLYSKGSVNTTMNYIGNDGLFKITSGSISKKYDATTDRLIYTVNGEAEINSLLLDMKVPNYGNLTVNSLNYELAVTNNVTLNIAKNSKLTINQNIALLPGVEMYIDEDADVTVAEGKKMYVYDRDEWISENYVSSKYKFRAIGYTHANESTQIRTEANLVDAKICVNGTLTAKGDIYTTAGGANICSTGSGKFVQTKEITGPETCTYQYTEGGSSTMTLHEIPITLAKLCNSNGSYVASPSKAETITYSDGKWVHAGESQSVAKKEATCTGAGHEAGTVCSICGATLTGMGEIAATGHTWNTTYTEDTPATCTTAGSESIHCRKCDAIKELSSQVIQAKNHSWGKWTEVDKNQHTRTCANDANHVETKDHTWNTGEVTTAATCAIEGVRTYTCSGCGAKKTEVIEKCAHTEATDAAVAPTCTTTGLTEGKHCSACGETLIPQTEIQATGHSYTNGKCTVCGAVKYVPSSGSTTTTAKENIINKAENKSTGDKATTTAYLESKVTSGRTTTTISAETGQKIVEKAVANKSAEVVIEVGSAKTAKTAEVVIPELAIKEIAEKTDAELVIKTGDAEISLDKAGIEELVAKAGTTEAIKIEVSTIESKEDICRVNVRFVTSSGKEVKFKKGETSVTVTPDKELFKKKLVCVYIDDNGIYHKVKGWKNADGTYTFMAS